MRVKLDSEVMQLSAIFERKTHTRVKYSFQDEDTIYFIVEQGDLGKALGKGASNLKYFSEKFKKRLKLIQYDPKVERFVANIIFPNKVQEIVLVDNTIEIRDSSYKTKGLIVGRNGKNLNFLKKALKRFHPYDVKVV